MSTISGGNKRKLSTSLAMMGNSSVILLDEPTTGLMIFSARGNSSVIIIVLHHCGILNFINLSIGLFGNALK